MSSVIVHQYEVVRVESGVVSSLTLPRVRSGEWCARRPDRPSGRGLRLSVAPKVGAVLHRVRDVRVVQLARLLGGDVPRVELVGSAPRVRLTQLSAARIGVLRGRLECAEGARLLDA